MRRKQKLKIEIVPDYKYNNIKVAKFINYLMWNGEKTIAEKIAYSAFDIIQEKTKKEPLEIFEQAIKNVSPILEVKSRRIGGANYQVPMEVRGERKLALAFRWIIQAARAKKGKAMKDKLAEELIAASNNEGAAVKKKQDTQRMAEANRAFAHFAW